MHKKIHHTLNITIKNNTEDHHTSQMKMVFLKMQLTLANYIACLIRTLKSKK